MRRSTDRRALKCGRQATSAPCMAMLSTFQWASFPPAEQGHRPRWGTVVNSIGALSARMRQCGPSVAGPTRHNTLTTGRFLFRFTPLGCAPKRAKHASPNTQIPLLRASPANFYSLSGAKLGPTGTRATDLLLAADLVTSNKVGHYCHSPWCSGVPRLHPRCPGVISQCHWPRFTHTDSFRTGCVRQIITIDKH